MPGSDDDRIITSSLDAMDDFLLVIELKIAHRKGTPTWAHALECCFPIAGLEGMEEVGSGAEQEEVTS